MPFSFQLNGILAIRQLVLSRPDESPLGSIIGAMVVAPLWTARHPVSVQFGALACKPWAEIFGVNMQSVKTRQLNKHL
jgi:hypothetical protein